MNRIAYVAALCFGIGIGLSVSPLVGSISAVVYLIACMIGPAMLRRTRHGGKGGEASE